jgi:dsDNA-specific endonuclease/ATPase MutS2
MLTSKTPKIDLHGEVVSMVYPLVYSFIMDNYKLNNKELLIIHGKSTNILTKEVHRVLKSIKIVKRFKLDNLNLGQTIVYLK